MSELDNYDNPQEALNERAEKLDTEVSRLTSALEQYENGWRDEEGVLDIGDDAREAYDQLHEVETAVLESVYDTGQHVQKVKMALEEKGYDSFEDFIADREPMSANRDERSIADIVSNYDIDWQQAHSAQESYQETVETAAEEHDIHIPPPESLQDDEIDEAIEGLSSGELDLDDLSLS